MKSKKSLFNPTLFKSNIRRFLPFSVLFAIIECVALPLVIYSTHITDRDVLDIDVFAVLNGISDVFVFAFAGAFAILTFGYLFSANKCNALHAFPIGRKSLFTTNFASAYVLLTVPQIIGYAIALPGIVMYSEMTARMLLLSVTSIFLFSFICLAIAVFAVMLAGNAFSCGVIYVIINFAYAAIIGLGAYATSYIGRGMYDSDYVLSNANYYLSPLVNLAINRIKLVNVYNSADDAQKYYLMLVVYTALAVLLCVFAFSLYRKRELECAGDMTVYGVEAPIFRTLVGIVGGGVASFILGSIIDFALNYLILYILFFFVFYFATQMILMKKGNVFTKGLIIKSIIVCALSVCIIIGVSVCRTNYIPKPEDVKSVEVNTTYRMNSEDIEKVCKFHKAMIDYSKQGETSSWMFESKELYEDEETIDISIDYTLKNGKYVSRHYPYRLDDDKINKLIKAVEEESPYKTAFDLLEETKIDYTVTSVICYNYSDDAESKGLTLKPEDFEEFISCCKADTNAIKSNYSSIGSRLFDYGWSVEITCKYPKDTDKSKLEKLNDNLFNRESQIYMDEFAGIESTFTINLNAVPQKNSRIAKFFEEHYKG